MKLTRLCIEQIRQFRSPLEIDHFEPGLNIFFGPNEAGKSTIVRALRAAFFERFSTKKVADLLPWGDSGAAPHIELEFENEHVLHMLNKTFLKSARCDLYVGQRHLAGEEAEHYLGDLLGFQFAAKGESKAQHWGIPGLLWIEQGSGQEIHPSVSHAIDHLRAALQDELGAMASISGDEVLEAVRRDRTELLTGAGKPRGILAESIQRRSELTSVLEALDARIATYRQQVDQLGTWLRQQADDMLHRPWATYDQQRQAAETKRVQLTELERGLSLDRQRLGALEERLGLLQERLDDDAGRRKDLIQRETVLVDTEQRWTAAKVQEQHATMRQTELMAAVQAARAEHEMARLAADRQQLNDQIADRMTRLAEYTEQIARAERLSETLAQNRADAQTLALAEADIEALRGLHQSLRENAIRQEGGATRIGFDLQDGVVLDFDGQSFAGRETHLLVRSAAFQLPGVGRIQIEPGGADLPQLVQQAEALKADSRRLLQRLGVDSLEQAEMRFLTFQRINQDIREWQRELDRLAPQGVDALKNAQGVCVADLGQLRATLLRLPEPREGMPIPTVDDAHRVLVLAEAHRDKSLAAAQEAVRLRVMAEAEWAAADQECQRLRVQCTDPAEQQRAQETQNRLVEARAEATDLRARIDRQQSELDQARPDILDQDIERFRRSALQARQQFDERQNQIHQCQGQLQEAGAQGLEEQRSAAAVALEQAVRRNDELDRRARALDVLFGLLDARRMALTRRLQAPLQRHLNHYLQLLFPGSSLEIQEDLTPGLLARRSGSSEATLPDATPYDALSFGAREQIGLISRLAYADLLKEAGRPTLIILDDVLVHSDSDRLAQMKRALFDAATRHQILLFTCHPAHWTDMGVALRALDSLRPSR